MNSNQWLKALINKIEVEETWPLGDNWNIIISFRHSGLAIWKQVGNHFSFQELGVSLWASRTSRSPKDEIFLEMVTIKITDVQGSRAVICYRVQASFLQKNCRLQRHSNLEHQSRRQASWPLGHQRGHNLSKILRLISAWIN